jgi:hypothetical protein
MKADPICKQLCTECEHVIVKYWFGFSFMPYQSTVFWQCKTAKKYVDCIGGKVEMGYCDDNRRGECPRFTPKA